MERIGEYLVRRLVGEGGMGKVYEAEERLTKRRVALKVLRPELTKSEEGRRLFLNEMSILAHLEHPGIVRSLASMEEGEQLVMALEFVDGKTLRTVLNERGRLPWLEAADVVAQIARALAAAHAQEPPIIHRDLKPENVMLDASGAVKVMDFGIAKVLEAAGATNTQSIGTLLYMSPEQIDAKTIDARSDLYALGLVLYELLTGRPPFQSASPRELLNMQCTAEPPELEDDARTSMPSGVEDLLFELLAKSPEARPASAADVAKRLDAFKPAQRASRTTTKRIEAPSPAPRTDPPSPTPRADTQPPKPRADTVALVERATAPTQIPTAIALLLILALSLVAGFSVYVVRLRAGAPSDAPTPTAGAKP
jgi:serine/threonine-protein kinase